MKNALLLLIFASFLNSALAQPTLTNANSSPVAGDKYIGYGIDLTVANPPIPGPAGPAQNWNFVQWQTYPSIDTAKYVSCASTPYCDSFPGSTVTGFFYGNDYIYYLTDANKFESMGAFAAGHREDGHNDIILKYPFTYGSADTNLYYTSYPFGGVYGSDLDSITADAYGSLTLPYSLGTYSNVLRIHEVLNQIDTFTSTTPPNIQHNRYEYYYWFAPGFHHPLVYFLYARNPTTQVMELNLVRIYTGTYTAPTGLNETTNNDLLQVYPNPANDMVHINYNTSNDADVTLILSDMLGRTVAETTGSAGKGSIPTASLINGIYLLQLHSAEQLVTKQIQVQH